MALEGTLHDMPLLDLFDMFQVGSKSGLLRVTCATQDSLVYVSMGRVIDATVTDLGTRQVLAVGDEAILRLFQWDAADFVFSYDRSTLRHPVTVYHDIPQLVRVNDCDLASPCRRAPLPQMTMAIAANQAFAQDLGPLADALDWQTSRHYRRLCEFSICCVSASADPLELGSAALPEVPKPAAAPPPGAATHQAPAIAPVLATSPGPVGGAPALQPVQVRRVSAPVAGRNLLAAVLRRVREL